MLSHLWKHLWDHFETYYNVVGAAVCFVLFVHNPKQFLESIGLYAVASLGIAFVVWCFTGFTRRF